MRDTRLRERLRAWCNRRVPLLPHGPIEEVFPDVFLVRGSFAPSRGIRFDRNMTIVRKGGELVVLNSVRLSDDGEAQLAKLGKLKHVVRLGAFHGADDGYFVERCALPTRRSRASCSTSRRRCRPSPRSSSMAASSSCATATRTGRRSRTARGSRAA
jgi:hypothetical protein